MKGPVTNGQEIPGITKASFLRFRLLTALLAALLFTQCIWVLLSEFSRSDIADLPTEMNAASVAAKQRVAASLAASIGFIRGDLWAESAFTYTDLATGTPISESSPQTSEAIAQARASINH